MSLLGGLLGQGWRSAPQGNTGSVGSASAPGPDAPAAGASPATSPDPAAPPVGGSGWPKDSGSVTPAGGSPAAPGNNFVPRSAGTRATGTPTDAQASRQDFGVQVHLPDDAARTYALAGQQRERITNLVASLSSGPHSDGPSSEGSAARSSVRNEAGGSSGYADHLGTLRGQGSANGKVLDRAA
jgi:hypothetical protein